MRVVHTPTRWRERLSAQETLWRDVGRRGGMMDILAIHEHITLHAKANRLVQRERGGAEGVGLDLDLLGAHVKQSLDAGARNSPPETELSICCHHTQRLDLPIWRRYD